MDCQRLCLRNDKIWDFTIIGMKVTLSLRGDNEGSDAAIHRVSGYACGLLCSIGDGQWIATAFSPRDDRPQGARDDKMETIEPSANRSV